MSTNQAALAVVEGEDRRAVAGRELLPPPTAWRQMQEMAAELVKSGLLPPTVKTPQAALAIMVKGRELGLPAMAAIAGITVISGKPTCSAELMLALVRRDHGPGAIRVAKSDNDACTVEWKTPGWGDVQRYAFTMADAQRAGLAQSQTWQKYPAAMLRARCISAVVRMAFPESIGGMHTPEELGATVEVDSSGAVVVNPEPEPERPRERVRPAVEVLDAPEPANDAPRAPQRATVVPPEGVTNIELNPDGPAVNLGPLHGDFKRKGYEDPHAVAHAIGCRRYNVASLTKLTPRDLHDYRKWVEANPRDVLDEAWAAANDEARDGGDGMLPGMPAGAAAAIDQWTAV